MTNLQCGVTNCLTNKNNLCCRNDIHVEGPSAQHSGDTCCNNFVERSASGFTNSTADSTAYAATKVACAATDCSHNNQNYCAASSISISGSGAANRSQTQCDSFSK